LYSYDVENQAFKLLKNSVFKYWVKNHIYQINLLENKNLVFSTTLKGAAEMDSNFNLVRYINKQNGLANEKIWSAYNVENQPLWLGTDNGFAKVETHSPWSYFPESLGISGTVYDVLRYNGVLYVATSQGVFYLAKQNKRNLKNFHPAGQFKQIQGLTSQAWSLCEMKIYPNNDTSKKAKTKLLVATTTGIYEIQKFRVKKIIENQTSYFLQTSKLYPNRVFAGLSQSIISLKFEKNKWKIEKPFSQIKDLVRSFVIDNQGVIFLGMYYSGVAKIEILSKNVDKNGFQIFDSVKYSYFSKKDGLPSDLQNGVTFLNNKIYFTTEKGLYLFENQRIVRDSEFFTDSFGILYATQDSEKNIWVIGYENGFSKMILLEKQKNQKYKIVEKPFKRVNYSATYVVLPENNGIAWFGSTDGLLRFDKNVRKNYSVPFSCLIRKINIGKDSTIFWGTNFDSLKSQVVENQVDKNVKIKFSLNSVVFEYSATFYEGEIFYSYYLENFDNQWSTFSKESKREYTNLKAGKYSFKVKAKNIYGNESVVASYDFEILPPWYLTFWAFFGYFLLFIFLIWAVVRLNMRRLEKANLLLENTVKERTAEIMQQNEEISAQRDTLEKLNTELFEKNTEILQQNEEITQQNEEIAAQRDSLEELNKELSVRNAEISQQNEEIAAQRDSLESLNLEMCSLNFEVMQQNEEITQQKNVLETLNAELNIRNEEIAAQRDALKVYNKEVLKQKNRFEGLNAELNIRNEEILEQNDKIAAQRDALELLNIELGSKNTEIQEQHQALEMQNHQIQFQNEQIKASIRYANTIQQAMLPQEKFFKTAFTDYFILFRPKDIVSGDFYWMSHLDSDGSYYEKIFLALVDCTGHGVPGAFMSMVGIRLLNEIINEKKVYSPRRILENLDESIKKVLQQNENENEDGMDIALLLIENYSSQEKRITFSGAKHSACYVSFQNKEKNGEIQLLKGTRKSIGGTRFKNSNLLFENQEVILQKGDVMYLTSDGFIDQANSERKRFGTKEFLQLLTKNAALPMISQRETLEIALKTHQQNEEQRDDITVIGIKI